MDKDLILTNENFIQIRKKIESAQEIINGRRKTIIVIGIILLGLISYGLSLLISVDMQFLFCGISGLGSIIISKLIADRVDEGHRKLVSQKLANELRRICFKEGWQLGSVVDVLNVQYSNKSVFREITAILNIIPSENMPINLSSDGNIFLRALREIMVPYGLGFRAGTEEWIVLLTPSAMEFDSVDGETADKDEVIHFSISRGEANVRMSVMDGKGEAFTQLNGRSFGTIVGINATQAVPETNSAPEIKYGAKFLIARQDATLLKSWLDETPDEIREPIEKKVSENLKAAMLTAIRNRGAGLVVWGIAHFVFSNYLDARWGAILLAIGVVNLASPRRGLFILNGLALILVGIWNIYTNFFGGIWGFYMIGGMQILWGIEEIERFGHFALAIKSRPSKGSRVVEEPKHGLSQANEPEQTGKIDSVDS